MKVTRDLIEFEEISDALHMALLRDSPHGGPASAEQIADRTAQMIGVVVQMLFERRALKREDILGLLPLGYVDVRE